MVQKDNNTVLFSMSRTSNREKLFKWVGPVVSAKIVVLAKKSDNYKINSIEDLNKYRIGTVAKDIGEQLLIKNGTNKKNIKPTPDININIKKLNKEAWHDLSFWNSPESWGKIRYNFKYKLILPKL